MKLGLFLLPRAEKDIDEHCTFIARTSLATSLAFDHAVFESLDRLSTHPELGSTVNTNDPRLIDLRMWFVKGFRKYLVFYRVFGNYIEVIRVLHSAQDRDNILLDEDKE